MPGKFELFKRPAGHYFRLKAGNGEPILASESYTTKAGAENGIQSVKTNAPLDTRYEKKQTSAGYSFVLKAANGEPIGRSEVYTTAASRDKGIESVKTNAPGAAVDDLT
jgi:uncharacterized protein YegP (UPF0339 family)